MNYFAIVHKNTLEVVCIYKYTDVNTLILQSDFPEEKYYYKEIPLDIRHEFIKATLDLDTNEVYFYNHLEKYIDTIRTIRNQRLIECDWTQANDSPLSDEKKEEWRIYRQALRDLPNQITQVDDALIPWPIKPT